MTRALAMSAIASAALLLGGCATPRLSTEHKIAAVEDSLAGARYVAIGSSFAAGPLLPPAKSGAPARCGQSFNNYPTLLAERFGMVLVDRSCSGATTDHVLGAWGDIPAQIDSVTPDTRLVTVTIGGNDLSYIGNLFSATCAFNATALTASGMKAKPCAPVKVPSEADYQRAEKQLNEIARRVRATAPKARLVFVQYLTPLGSLCSVTPVSPANAAIVREIGQRLGEITERAALANGALVIEMNRASATHTPCDPDPWMIGAPQGYDGKQGLQWHLNKAGMQATADSLAHWLVQAGVKPPKPAPAVTLPFSQQAPTATPPETLPKKPGAPEPQDITPEGDAP